MNAHDRFLPEWFSRIQSGQITRPRFRRFIGWSHSEVSGLLTTVLRGLPSGGTLILEVGDEEKLVSRTIADAPEWGAKVTEQLLDGRQRLTALWYAFHDLYPDRTYLVGFEESARDPKTALPYVYGQARWLNNERRYPVWVDAAAKCWGRHLIPIRLLRPGDMDVAIDQWIDLAISGVALGAHHFQTYKAVEKIINRLRTQVREFNLPYLALPASTPKEVALDVFLKSGGPSSRVGRVTDRRAVT